jgi:diguanylate cyclase (GGDEF)-like protein
MKILVIDDEAGERAFLEHYLCHLGYQVVCTGDGISGVEAYLGEAPDLVLLDIMMPGIDGEETARRMRMVSPEWIPIIFLSGCNDSTSIISAIEAGGDDYLVKPFDLKMLDAKMRSMQRIASMRQRLVEQAAELTEANVELARLAEMDGLTGIPNRRRLDRKLDEEVSRCARSRHPLSVILLDIDHFKRLNDTHGHQVGDECLRLIGSSLADQLRRPADLVARYGGEEFCVVLPDTSSDGAEAIAEQLRKTVSGLILQTPQGEARMTVSLGVATSTPCQHAEAEQLLAHADAALYEAKEGGRNTVRKAAEASSTPVPAGTPAVTPGTEGTDPFERHAA